MARSTRQAELTEAALKERALRLLATREHSRFELRRKLMRGTPSRSRLLRGRAPNKAASSAGDGASASTSASNSARVNAWADAVLDDLEQHGLLSDARFAESFVRRGIDRGHGPLKIRAGLRSRAVADDIIDDALTFSDDFWLECARAAQAKRFGKARNPTNNGGGTGEGEADDAPANRSEWARRARFLAARGFASDTIYRTLAKAS